MKKYFIALLLLSFLSVWPFFKKGYFESHDGEWMVIRFSAFHQALRTGQMPVRFLDRLNNNYGYPVANFLYPLPFYLAEIPKALGASFVNSIKIVFVLSTIASSVALFWALIPLFSASASFLGAITYLFIPYRFVDLYVRGSLGENVAFVFVALSLGCIIRISKDKKIFLPLLAVCTALLITSHNVIALLFIPIFFVIALLLQINIKKLLLSYLLAFLLSAFYWVPAIYDLKYVQFKQSNVSNVSDHLVNFKDLITTKWGFGPTPTAPNGFSVQFGIIAYLAMLLAIIAYSKSKRTDKTIPLLFTINFVVFFLMSKFSATFWKFFPIEIIQFPWRLLSLIILTTSILIAGAVNSLKIRPIVIYVLVTLSILFNLTYIKPVKFINKGDSYYSTNEDTTTVKDEYLPKWVKKKAEKRAANKIELVGDGKIISSDIKNSSYKVTVENKSPTKIIVNTIYFPGWEVLANGKKIPLYHQNESGIMEFYLPEGSFNTIIRYGNTPMHVFAELLSVIGAIGVIYYINRIWRKRNS